MFRGCLTLRVDVRVVVSCGIDAKQRLRADAAEIHLVNIQHHAGHYSLVEQRWTSYLKNIGR